MSETMRVRMLRPYGAYKVGEVVETTPDLAERWIAWAYAVREKQQSLLETAAVEPVAERADVTPRRKGKQR